MTNKEYMWDIIQDRSSPYIEMIGEILFDMETQDGLPIEMSIEELINVEIDKKIISLGSLSCTNHHFKHLIRSRISEDRLKKE